MNGHCGWHYQYYYDCNCHMYCIPGWIDGINEGLFWWSQGNGSAPVGSWRWHRYQEQCKYYLHDCIDVCMYICMYRSISVDTYVRMTSVYTYVICMHICIWIFVNISIDGCAFICVCIYVCMIEWLNYYMNEWLYEWVSYLILCELYTRVDRRH